MEQKEQMEQMEKEEKRRNKEKVEALKESTSRPDFRLGMLTERKVTVKITSLLCKKSQYF